MPKRDKLFQLVRSLSKTEKRYFSIYAQLHTKSENNDYLKLFREFERHETLDETKIKANLSGQRLLEHYAVTKSYLYDLILKAMRSYSKHSDDKRVLDLIQDVEFLASKGIFDQALQLLYKAREISEQQGLLANLDLLLHWEKRIHLASGFVYFNEQRLEGLSKEQAKVQLQRRLQNRLWLKNAIATGKRLGRLYGDGFAGEISVEEMGVLNEIKAKPKNDVPRFFMEVQDLILTGSFQPALVKLLEAKENWLAKQYHSDYPLLFVRLLSLILETYFELGDDKAIHTELESVGQDSEWLNQNDYVVAWYGAAVVFYMGYKAVLNSDELALRQFVNAWNSRPILDQLYVVGYESKALFFMGYAAFLRKRYDEAEQEFAYLCRFPDDWPCLSLIYGAWLFRIMCHAQLGSWKKVVRAASKWHERLVEDGLQSCIPIQEPLKRVALSTNGNEVFNAVLQFQQQDLGLCFPTQGRGNLFAVAAKCIANIRLEELHLQEGK
jgi:tetratricopeptide (TPR) repeat protein